MGKQWKTIADKGEIREGRHTITGTHVGRHWETKRGDKTSGRQTHHPTQALVGRQWETMGDNGRQWETIGSREDKGRQDLGKADAPSNTGRQRDKTSGRRTHHPKHARTHVGRKWETRGDKTSGRRTHRPTQADKTRPHPTRAHMWGDNRRQKGETRRRKGGRTIQHRHLWGDNGRQGGAIGDKTSGRRTHHPTQAHMWGANGKHWDTRAKQDFEKANTSSSTGTHKWGDNGRQVETRRREGGHTIQEREEGVQWETEGDKTLSKRKQEGAQWETRGDKTLGEADAPSNKGKQEGVQWQTRGEKTPRKADTPPNKGKQEGVQWETRGDNTFGKADTPSNKRKQGSTLGDKVIPDPWEGGHTIQQRETRRGTMGDQRRQHTREFIDFIWSWMARLHSIAPLARLVVHVWIDPGLSTLPQSGSFAAWL